MDKVSTRLVKTEDLNHHGTLFAGRMSEWFVEGCFVKVATAYGHPENIVCLKVHEIKFMSPIRRGDILEISSEIVHAGETSLIVYSQTKRHNDNRVLVEGFATFICVDENGKKMPHCIKLSEPQTEREKELREEAKKLTIRK